MSLTILSHIVAWNGRNCRRCGQSLPVAEDTQERLVGRRVGVIIAPISGATTVYPTGENDSNELCEPVGLVASILHAA